MSTTRHWRDKDEWKEALKRRDAFDLAKILASFLGADENSPGFAIFAQMVGNLYLEAETAGVALAIEILENQSPLDRAKYHERSGQILRSLDKIPREG